MHINILKTYFNWSMNFLIGLDQNASDRFLNQNLQDIKTAAKFLLDKTGYQPTEIYRGILMNEPNLTVLEPHKNMWALSFTDSKEVAEHFGNPGGFGAEFGINHHLGEYGYVVSYTPQVDEVLFHHKFIDILPYREAFNNSGLGSDNLEKQKEVIIMQPKEPMRVCFIN